MIQTNQKMSLEQIDFCQRLQETVEKLQQTPNQQNYAIIRLEQNQGPKNKYMILNKEQISQLFQGNHDYSAHEVSPFPERKFYLDIDLKITLQQKHILEQNYGELWENEIINIAMDNVISQIEVNNKDLLTKYQPQYIETNQKNLFYKYFDKYTTSRFDQDKYKISWHLIFMPEIYYVTIEDLKHAMGWANAKVSKELMQKFPNVFQEHVSIIDTQVYSKNGCLRLLGCSKLGQTQKKISMNDFSLDDLKNAFRPLVSKTIDCDGQRLIRLHLFQTMNLQDSYDDGHSIMSNSQVSEDISSIIDTIKQKCEEINNNDIYTGKYKGYKRKSNLISIQFTYTDKCNFCDRKHSKIDHHYGVSWEGSNYLYINCYRNNQPHKRLKVKIYDNCIETLSESPSDVEFQELYDKMRLFNTKYDTIQPNSQIITESINEKQLTKSYSSYDDFSTLFVKSSMGTGKTMKLMEFISEFIQENEQNEEEISYQQRKIYVVSFRISFSQDYLIKVNQHLENLNIKSRFQIYNELNVKQISNAQYLIIQIESLNKLGISNLKPDLLILDESEHIMQQLNSSLSSDESKNYSIFQQLVTNSTQVIAIDAFMGERTTNFILSCRKCKCDPEFQITVKQCPKCDVKINTYLIDNAYKTPNKYIFYKNGEACLQKWYEKIQNYINLDKNIAIPCNNANMAMQIYDQLCLQFPRLKNEICVYTQKVNTKQKYYDLLDLQKSWCKYRILIYTPTILAGISFEQTHYHAIFGYFDSNINPVETFQQMLGRIRQVNDREYHIYIKKATIFEELGLTLSDIDNKLRFQAYITCNQLPGGMSFNINKSGEIQVSNSGYYLVYLHNQRILNLSKKEPLARFINCIGEQQQIEIIIDESKFKNGLNQNAKERKKQQHKSMIRQPLMDQTQIQPIIEKNIQDEIEQKQITKYFLYESLGLKFINQNSEKIINTVFEQKKSIDIWENSYKYMNIILQYGSIQKAQKYYNMKFNVSQINNTLQNDPLLAKKQINDMLLFQSIEKFENALGKQSPFFIIDGFRKNFGIISLLNFIITYNPVNIINIPHYSYKLTKLQKIIRQGFPKDAKQEQIIIRYLECQNNSQKDEYYNSDYQATIINSSLQNLPSGDKKRNFIQVLKKQVKKCVHQLVIHSDYHPVDLQQYMAELNSEEYDEQNDDNIAIQHDLSFIFINQYKDKIERLRIPKISEIQEVIRTQIIWAFLFQKAKDDLIIQFPKSLKMCPSSCFSALLGNWPNQMQWSNQFTYYCPAGQSEDSCSQNFNELMNYSRYIASKFTSLEQVLKLQNYSYIVESDDDELMLQMSINMILGQ